MQFDFMFWASSVAACISLTGAYLNANKKWYSFVVWAAANLFWLVYDFSVGAYFQSALFATYLAMNVYGLYCWKFCKNNEIDDVPSSCTISCDDKNAIIKSLKTSGVEATVIAKAMNLSEAEILKI